MASTLQSRIRSQSETISCKLQEAMSFRVCDFYCCHGIFLKLKLFQRYITPLSCRANKLIKMKPKLHFVVGFHLTGIVFDTIPLNNFTCKAIPQFPAIVIRRSVIIQGSLIEKNSQIMFPSSKADCPESSCGMGYVAKVLLQGLLSS